MATDVNIWVGEGFVGRDPKITRNGDMLIAETVIAIGKDWHSKKTGQRETKTTWIEIKAYGRIAEFLERNIIKGSRIWVCGELDCEEWEDKNTGVKRNKFAVIANSINFGYNPRNTAEYERKKSDVTQSEKQTHVDGPPQGAFGMAGEVPF